MRQSWASDDYAVPAFRAPVLASPDVCVVGGGSAGVAAAVAAARQGLDTLLLEKYGFCGGATVAGLSGTICGLYSSGSHPRQVAFGFAGEFHDRLKAAGGAGEPVPFGRTRLVPHDSLTWKETADSLLQEANARVLYHSYFLDAFVNPSDGAVDALLVRLVDGYRVIRPKMVVDASGDALVVHAVGGGTRLGDNGVVQTPTMIFRLGNVDVPAFCALDTREICDAVRDADRSGRFRLPRHHVYIFPMPNHREVLCNMTRITYPDGRVPLGICSADLTFAEMEGRRQAREYARFLKQTFKCFSESYLVETGAQVGIRETRSIQGMATLTNQDVLQGRKRAGAAASSAWPIEVHGGGGVKIAYLEDELYDVPFEALVPQGAANLLAAGRCLSAEHEALASARVTAQCLSMGYAAGAACGLALREGLKARSLTGILVAEWMKHQNLRRHDER